MGQTLPAYTACQKSPRVHTRTPCEGSIRDVFADRCCTADSSLHVRFVTNYSTQLSSLILLVLFFGRSWNVQTVLRHVVRLAS